MMLRGVLLVALGLFGCSTTPSKDDRILVSGPRADEFATGTGAVEPVFERRCGSFDCHGNPSRAMRIYGQQGLRMPNEAGAVPGGLSTTPDEINSNYRSIIGVEPEQINVVVKDNGASPDLVYTLLILKKPLNIENHKGGPVMNKGDATERCITSWLQGTVNRPACTSGAALP
jgi:hypothetical protein